MNLPIDDSIPQYSQFGSQVARIIIAGGGTGGHIFPAIAIANAIVRIQPKTEILFVGAKGKMEMEKVPLAGYRIEGLTIAGFNRSSLIKNIGLPFKLLKSFIQVKNIFKEFKPTAVVGVGGYSSFPVLRFAQLTKEMCVRTILEKNTIMWEVNIWYLIYQENPDLFDFYDCEHDRTMIDGY